jgi:hypothetical protein
MKQTTNEKIDALTNAIEKLISRPVAPILPVAPIAPIAPILPIEPVNSGDHDAITKLVVTVGVIDTKVDKLQEAMDGRLDKMEREIEVIKLWKSNLVGKMSVIVGATTLGVSVIALWIGKTFGL